MKDLTYEQTIELEENIKIKKKAETIYSNFLKNIKLSPADYRSKGFMFWHDSHNSAFFTIDKDGHFNLECVFLHERYSVLVTPSGIFDALKLKYKGVEHLEYFVNKQTENC